MRMNSTSRGWRIPVALVCTLVALWGSSRSAVAQRVLGLDISAWQGNISQGTWNNIHNIENRDFVFLRSSRGGTTGYYHPGGGYPAGNNSAVNLSQRYDDPYFVQNINRATSAGMFAGAYHFSRPDIIASTPNSGGIANSGTDEANHFIQMAGAWMRPGYLLPVHDLEAGDGIRTDNEMAQFAIDFSDRIYEVMGFRPATYVNGNYANYVLGGASSTLRAQVYQAYPTLWIARWPNQGNPNAIDVQNEQPSDSLSWLYGLWDDYGNSQPWAFWQYASTGKLQSFNNGNSNLDFDVSHGDIEYLKDYLVPALWMNDSSGDWSTLTNWNSGQPAIAPLGPPAVPSCGSCSSGTGQLTPAASGPLPTVRLPGAAGSGPTSGQHDTVILDRPNANITVTLSSGTHNIRKLYVRETLNITGGSLTVNYDPDYVSDTVNYPNALRSGPISAQFSGAVSLSGSGALNVHTLRVDPTQTFTLGGGTLTFDTIELMPHSSIPARIAVTGAVAINPLNDGTATISNGAGAGSSGRVDLSGGSFNVGDGLAAVDLSVDVPMINGALTKTGPGTMRLGATNSHTGQTTVNGGILLASANNQLGANGVVTGPAGTLQLSGNVSYSLPLTIGGGGANGVSVAAPGNPGALDNLSGDNTWSGAVTLAGTGSGGTDPLLNQIGAQANSLRLSGVIQNDTGVSATWAKTGGGDVILSGASPNTYSGLTRLSGGRLIVEKDGGLGTAGSTSGADGNTFQLAGSASTLAFRAPGASSGFSYNSFEVINTHGTGAPGLGQVDNLGGDNTFAGQIAFDGPDSGGARLSSIGVSSGSLHVTGGLYARGSDGAPRNISKSGAGRLILSGDGGAATGNPLVVPLANSVFNVNGGTVELRGPSPTTANLPGVILWHVNSGALEIASGGFSTTTVNVQSGGEFKLTGGTANLNTLNLLGGGTVDVSGGTLHVNSVQGNLTNQGGMLGPGQSAGFTLLTGNYTQESGAGLQIEIGGVPGGGQHDALGVSGVATLDGVLDVSLINGFTPTAGQQFTVVGASALVNNGLTLGGSAASLFNMIVGGTSIILEAVSTMLPGDFNDDGMVDAADYVVWRKTSGEPASYTEWQANYGQTQGSGSGGGALGSVPEPGSFGLLAVAVGIVQLAGGRRQRRR